MGAIGLVLKEIFQESWQWSTTASIDVSDGLSVPICHVNNRQRIHFENQGYIICIAVEAKKNTLEMSNTICILAPIILSKYILSHYNPHVIYLSSM